MRPQSEDKNFQFAIRKMLPLFAISVMLIGLGGIVDGLWHVGGQCLSALGILGLGLGFMVIGLRVLKNRRQHSTQVNHTLHISPRTLVKIEGLGFVFVAGTAIGIAVVKMWLLFG